MKKFSLQFAVRRDKILDDEVELFDFDFDGGKVAWLTNHFSPPVSQSFSGIFLHIFCN